MSDRDTPRNFDIAEPATGDPDMDSTWSTIDGTADIEALVNEEDLENFLVEPVADRADVTPAADEGTSG